MQLARCERSRNWIPILATVKKLHCRNVRIPMLSMVLHDLEQAAEEQFKVLYSTARQMYDPICQIFENETSQVVEQNQSATYSLHTRISSGLIRDSASNIVGSSPILVYINEQYTIFVILAAKRI